MAKLRNKSDDELETKVNGRSYVTKPDGLLEIPDDVYLEHAWPATIWADVEVPKVPDVSDTIAGIKREVGDDPVKARAALDAENTKDEPRKSLLAWLESVINGQEG